RGAAGAAHQDALAPGQRPRRVERLSVADADPLVHQLAVERLGHEVFADALHLPRPRGVARQHRPLRVRADDAHLGVLLLQVAGPAGDRPARAHAGHEGADLPLGLLPDLEAGRAVMYVGVGEVGELVGPPGAGDLAREAVGHAVVAVGRVGR